jgi:hypothetical protein
MAGAKFDVAQEIDDTLNQVKQFNDLERLLFQKEVETRRDVNSQIAQALTQQQQLAQLMAENQKKPTARKTNQQNADDFLQRGMQRQRVPKVQSPVQTRGALQILENQMKNPAPGTTIPAGPGQPAPLPPQTPESIEEEFIEETQPSIDAVGEAASRDPLLLENVGFQDTPGGLVVEDDFIPAQDDIPDRTPFQNTIESIISKTDDLRSDLGELQADPQATEDQLLSQSFQDLKAPEGIGLDEGLAGGVLALAPIVLSALFGQPTSTAVETSKFGVKAADDFLKGRESEAKRKQAGAAKSIEFILKQKDQRRKESQKAAELSINEKKLQLMGRLFTLKSRKDQREAIRVLLENGWKENTFRISEQQIDRDYQKAWLKAVMKGKGLKPPTKLLEAIELAPAINRIISNLNDSLVKYRNKFGPVRGRWARFNPLDPIGQTIESQVRSLRQFVGKMREGGVLRKEDEIKYEKMLPSMADTPESFANKMNAMQNTWFEMMAVKRRVWEEAGIDPEIFERSGISREFIPRETGIEQEPGVREPGRNLRPAPPQKAAPKTGSLDAEIKRRKQRNEELRKTQKNR